MHTPLCIEQHIVLTLLYIYLVENERRKVNIGGLRKVKLPVVTMRQLCYGMIFELMMEWVYLLVILNEYTECGWWWSMMSDLNLVILSILI